MLDYNKLLYIDDNRQFINSLNFGSSSSGRATYFTKSELFLPGVEEIEQTLGSKIRSAAVYQDRLLIAGDFGLYMQDDTSSWVKYIEFSDGGDKYAASGWVENAIYNVSVIPHSQGDLLVIIGNFETFTLNPNSDNPFTASSKNFLVIREVDGVVTLPYTNIKEISAKLPMIKADAFPLISSANTQTFADDNIVSVYGNEDTIFVLDKGIYSFKDIQINDYGVVPSSISLYEPEPNLYQIDLSTNTLTQLTIRGEILSDTHLENSVYISSGVNKLVGDKKYYQTLYYTLDLTNNNLVIDNSFNFKTIKSLPINNNQKYLAIPNDTSGVSDTDLANINVFMDTERLSADGTSSKKDDTFFGKGSRSEPITTNGLQEENNIFSSLTANLSGLLFLTISMRWLVINQIPRNLKIVILKNGQKYQDIIYNPDDTTAAVSISILSGDKISFLVDEAYYGKLVIDFEAYIDNVDTYYAKQLAFAEINTGTIFNKIHNGIRTPEEHKQKSAVLLDINNNVWFLQPETLDYYVPLAGDEDVGKRLIRYNLPDYIQPVDVVMGDGVVAVLSLDGNIYTWGKNTYGQLGSSSLDVGTTIDQNPVKVDGGNYKSIFVCNNTFYAITNDGDMYAWGHNTVLVYPFHDNGKNIFDADDYYARGNLVSSNTMIPGLTDDYSLTPFKIIIALGLKSTPTARACGLINDTNINIVGKKWQHVSISPTDVYAIDRLGLMYHWGDVDTDNIFTLDAYHTDIRPRINKKVPSLIGAPGYTTRLLSSNEIANLYTATDNFYVSSSLQDFVLNDISIASTADKNLEPNFENRAIELLTLNNSAYKMSLILDDNYIYDNTLYIKNVKKGDKICQIKIQDKTQNSITTANNLSVNAAFSDVIAAYNGTVIIDLKHQDILSGDVIQGLSIENLYLHYYNIYVDMYDTNNPGAYTRVIHDSYAFENQFSDTIKYKAPIFDGYSRTSNLSRQTSSIVYFETQNGDSYIWSKNAIDSDTNNSGECINSLTKTDLSIGNTDNIFNHEILKYYQEHSQLLQTSLYHNNLSLTQSSNITLRFRLYDKNCGTRVFDLCDNELCVNIDKTEKTHDSIVKLKDHTNIRFTSLLNRSISIDSGVTDWNILTQNKTIFGNTDHYAITGDGIFILPYGSDQDSLSKYNYAYLLNDNYLLNIDMANYPNFVNSKAYVLSLLLYQSYIIVGGYFPDGNSQINKDNKFMIWDHYNKRVLQPFSTNLES